MTFSEGKMAVGILIVLNDNSRRLGWTAEKAARPVVDSLAAMGVASRYFYMDAPKDSPGSGMMLFVNGRSYRTSSGVAMFNPNNVLRELDLVRKCVRTTYKRNQRCIAGELTAIGPMPPTVGIVHSNGVSKSKLSEAVSDVPAQCPEPSNPGVLLSLRPPFGDQE